MGLDSVQKKERAYLEAKNLFINMVKESDDYEMMKEAEKKMKKAKKAFEEEQKKERI